MKTPRDIIFARHQAASPKLDAIRRSVVDELNNQGTKEQSFPAFLVSLFLRCSNKLWQELILPSRRTWAGLAGVWLVLLVINLAQREPVTAGKTTSAPTMMSFREQQRLMNELFADRSLPVAELDRPKTFSPRPRTEIFQTFNI
jgi:hypothetical protein